jgi:hypothetical protein
MALPIDNLCLQSNFGPIKPGSLKPLRETHSIYPYKLIVVDSDRDLSVGTDATALDNKQLTEYL